MILSLIYTFLGVTQQIHNDQKTSVCGTQTEISTVLWATEQGFFELCVTPTFLIFILLAIINISSQASLYLFNSSFIALQLIYSYKMNDH